MTPNPAPPQMGTGRKLGTTAQRLMLGIAAIITLANQCGGSNSDTSRVRTVSAQTSYVNVLRAGPDPAAPGPVCTLCDLTSRPGHGASAANVLAQIRTNAPTRTTRFHAHARQMREHGPQQLRDRHRPWITTKIQTTSRNTRIVTFWPSPITESGSEPVFTRR